MSRRKAPQTTKQKIVSFVLKLSAYQLCYVIVGLYVAGWWLM